MATEIKIYGERNTNTNYVRKLIELNLLVAQLPGTVPRAIMKAQRLLPGEEMVRDIYFRAAFRATLGWKHAAVPPFHVLKRYGGDSGRVGYMTITKNPYSWLLSLYRRPYHLRRHERLSFEEFLQQPWKMTGRDNAGSRVSSPVDLWNIKNRSYRNLPQSRTIHATTERIFEDPSGVIKAIADKFGIERHSDQFINHERSTKDETKNGDYYRDYYINERWRERLSPKAIGLINERLDSELLSSYGYEEISASGRVWS
ncbi:MAG TPA: hypothetical protein VFJ15_08340 [Oleiagrimonas sp.]|nr:hypothetical protein [Oleiagrimonas sp.]